MCCRSFVCRQTEEEEASGAKNEKRTKGGKKVALSIPPLPSSTTVKRQRIRFHSPTETCIIFLSSFFPFSSRLSHPPSSPFFSDVWPGKKFDFGVFGCGPTPTAHKKMSEEEGEEGVVALFRVAPVPPPPPPRCKPKSGPECCCSFYNVRRRRGLLPTGKFV